MMLEPAPQEQASPCVERFLQCLSQRVRHTVEVRDPSWHHGDTLELLTRPRVALCLHDMRGSATARSARPARTYAYFNNDVGGHASRNAVTLRRFLEVRS